MTYKNGRSYFTLYFAILWLLLLSSCMDSEIDSPVAIDTSYVNKQILIRAPDYSNTFKTSDPINLELKYNTNNEIVFPNDYNLRIYEDIDGKWVEIKEEPTERYPPNDIVLSPLKEMPVVQVIVLFPDLPSPSRKYSIRIYVIGDMKANGAVLEVAAYTDVVLYP